MWCPLLHTPCFVWCTSLQATVFAIAVGGLYCSGWLKRGPSGIIGSNIADARETVGALLHDEKESGLPAIVTPGGLSSVCVECVCCSVIAD